MVKVCVARKGKSDSLPSYKTYFLGLYAVPKGLAFSYLFLAGVVAMNFRLLSSFSPYGKTGKIRRKNLRKRGGLLLEKGILLPLVYSVRSSH